MAGAVSSNNTRAAEPGICRTRRGIRPAHRAQPVVRLPDEQRTQSHADGAHSWLNSCKPRKADRKSVVSGKSVAVRVDPCVRRIIKKIKQNNTYPQIKNN